MYDFYGPAAPDKYVCAECFTDPALSARVTGEEEPERTCDYCGEREAAPLQVVVDAIYEGLGSEWVDPAEELPYETREGGYQGRVYVGSELVYDYVEPFTDDFKLTSDIADSLAGEHFAQRNYFLLRRSEALRYGWEAFVEQVKHRTRYLFLQEDDGDFHPDNIPPGRMLTDLGDEILGIDCIRQIEAGTRIFRVRVDRAASRHTSADQLGTPRRQYAVKANRMSPAGIPMFYGAFDEKTALQETVDPAKRSGKVATVGSWVSTRDLLVVDLTAIGPVPSLFDEDRRHLREPTRFLRRFAAEVSKPINATPHIEYVPTQIVTEYFRHRLRTADDQPLDGMVYRSSQNGEPACVLFVEHDACGEWDGLGTCSNEPLLLLETTRTKRTDLSSWP